MYLYNGGTTEYQCSTISRFHPTRYRYTGSAELLHHAFGSAGGSCRKQNPTLNFQSRLHRTSLWSESHAPARFLMLCVIGSFCFSTSNNWMTVRMGYDFAMTWAKQRRGETPGQERHSGRAVKAFLTLSLLRAHFYTGVFHTRMYALRG